MSLHLLRYQGLAVNDYSVALGCLKAGATSTFAQLGFHVNTAYQKTGLISIFRGPQSAFLFDIIINI